MMMINPNELNSQSQMMVAQRRAEAEQYRLAQVALRQTDWVRERGQQRSWIGHLLGGLLARLSITRFGV